MKDSEYLRDLARRLRYIPVSYQIDDGDINTLNEIAEKLEMNEFGEKS